MATPPSHRPAISYDPTLRLLQSTLAHQPWRAARALMRRAGAVVRGSANGEDRVPPPLPVWTVEGLVRAAKVVARLEETTAVQPPDAWRVTWAHALRALDLVATAEEVAHLRAVAVGSDQAFRVARERVALALDEDERTALRHLAVLPSVLVPTPATYDLRAVRGANGAPLIPWLEHDGRATYPDSWPLAMLRLALYRISPDEGLVEALLLDPGATTKPLRHQLDRLPNQFACWAALFREALETRGAAARLAPLDLTPADLAATAARRLVQSTPKTLTAPPSPPLGRSAASDTHDDGLDLFEPPPSLRERFHAFRDTLRERLGPIDSGLLDELTLLALQAQQGYGLRLLISGAPGSGKSTLCRTLAELLGVPWVVLDASSAQESGYGGGWTAEWVVERLLEAARAHLGAKASQAECTALAARGVVLLDELGKLGISPGSVGVTLSKKLGAQTTLLALLGRGTPVSVADPRRAHHDVGVFDFDRVSFVACDAFSNLGLDRAPTTEELVIAGGLMRELVDRLLQRLHLPSPTAEQVVHRLRHSPDGVERTLAPLAADAGWQLRVTEEALRCAAMQTLRNGLDLRSASEWVVRSARTVLLRALREHSPSGELLVLPDDLGTPPDRVQGHSR